MANQPRGLQAFALISLTTLLALSLFGSFGTVDTHSWLRWISNLTTSGFQQGYVLNQDNYPPLSSAMVLVAARFGALLGLTPFQSLKLCLLACLLLTSFIFWCWTRNVLLTMALQLALTPSAIGLTSVDILFAPTLIAALWALHSRKLFLFTVLYVITCLIKWQPLIIAPFLLVYLLQMQHWRDWRLESLKRLWWPVLFPAIGIVLAVFSAVGAELMRSFQRALSHAYLSGDALNFNWVITYLLHVLVPQSFGPLVNGQAQYIISPDWRLHLFSKILFGAAYLVVLTAFIRHQKTFEALVLCALTGYLAYYILNTGVHENHMFMIVILSAVLVALNPGHLLLFIDWGLAANLNLFIFWGFDGSGPPISRTVGIDLTVVLAVLNVLLFLGLFTAVTAKHRSLLIETSS